MPAIDRGAASAWLASVAALHGCSIGRINYIFMDDEAILELNRRALGHDYYTDVITFDYSDGPALNGDIYISLDTVASNAEMVGAPYDVELHRVIVHGLLHLCGINDKGPGEREVMENNENQALSLLSL
ncbi:MAG: rRNA maturation RNase YbeY [Alloprevotella sp.]|nr:rRNA maturation RNase YbeY [Alloprevotella sp.]